MATFKLGLWSTAPVLGSYCQPCHGQTTFPSSTVPWPSGPPRCRQMLSMAEYSPATLATQMTFSPAVNSLACPSVGSSDLAVILMNAISLPNPESRLKKLKHSGGALQ